MRYNNVTINRDKTGKRYYKPVLYPIITPSDEDVYIITTDGDRLDNLAYEFFRDAKLWWILLVCNESLKKDSLFVERGIQLRIPSNPFDIISEFERINNNR